MPRPRRQSASCARWQPTRRHIDGRGRQWRFAAGCAGAALLLPPWGRPAAAMWAMAAVAVGMYAFVAGRYELGAGDWVLAVMALAGAAGTPWGGHAVAGRRIARLAALSAGLGLFRCGTLAVAVIGAAGHQPDCPEGATPSGRSPGRSVALLGKAVERADGRGRWPVLPGGLNQRG